MQKTPQAVNGYSKHRKLKTIKEFWRSLNKKQKTFFVIGVIFALLVFYVFAALLGLLWIIFSWVIALTSTNLGFFALSNGIPVVVSKFSKKASLKEVNEYEGEYKNLGPIYLTSQAKIKKAGLLAFPSFTLLFARFQEHCKLNGLLAVMPSHPLSNLVDIIAGF